MNRQFDIVLMSKGLDVQTIKRIESVSKGDKKLLDLGLFMALKKLPLEVVEAGLKAHPLFLSTIPSINFDFTRSWEFDPSANYIALEDEYQVLLFELIGKIVVSHRLACAGFTHTFRGILENRREMAKSGITTDLSDEQITDKIAECHAIAECADWTLNKQLRDDVFIQLREKFKKEADSIELSDDELTFNIGETLPVMSPIKKFT